MKIGEVLVRENLNYYFTEDYSSLIWQVVPEYGDESCEVFTLKNIEHEEDITQFHYLAEIIKMEFTKLTKEELDEQIEFC